MAILSVNVDWNYYHGNSGQSERWTSPSILNKPVSLYPLAVCVSIGQKKCGKYMGSLWRMIKHSSNTDYHTHDDRFWRHWRKKRNSIEFHTEDVPQEKRPGSTSFSLRKTGSLKDPYDSLSVLLLIPSVSKLQRLLTSAIPLSLSDPVWSGPAFMLVEFLLKVQPHNRDTTPRRKQCFGGVVLCK